MVSANCRIKKPTLPEEKPKGRKDDGQVIQVDENLEIIWYNEISAQDLEDFKNKGIKINLSFNNKQELLAFLKKENTVLSTKKFILLTSGYNG